MLRIKQKDYLEFLSKCGHCSIVLDRHVIEFTFLLIQQFEPSFNRFFQQFRDSERHGAHEIVRQSEIVIPYFDGKPLVFVTSCDITVFKEKIEKIFYLALQMPILNIYLTWTKPLAFVTHCDITVFGEKRENFIQFIQVRMLNKMNSEWERDGVGGSSSATTHIFFFYNFSLRLLKLAISLKLKHVLSAKTQF